MQMDDRNTGAQDGPVSANAGQARGVNDPSSDPRSGYYCTPSGLANVQEAYRSIKREDLVSVAAHAARETKCDIGRLTHIATALAGARLLWERRLGYALLHIASAEDLYARCNLAQEYASGGDLPQDLDLAEGLFRSVVADVPADHLPLGVFARRALADLLVERGRDDEAKVNWQEIAAIDKNAAYLVGCACERDAVASGSSEELGRVAHFYRLAAISGHAAAMLALARVLTSGTETTQSAREEAQLWLLRATQATRPPAGAAPRPAARNQHPASGQ